MAVVVIDEDAKDTLEVASVQDQEPVEALGADGPHEAFGDRVRLRCANRRPDDLDAFAAEDGVEVACELAVAIADQEARRRRALAERPCELTSLLGDPRAGRVRRAASEVDAPTAELDEEEDVEALQRDSLDGEKCVKSVPPANVRALN